MAEQLDKVQTAVSDLDMDNIAPLVREALDSGQAPKDVLDAMCAGMAKVGELFEQGEYYLADLVLAGEGMKEGVAVLEPLLAGETLDKKGTVVACTVKGDIHDIGKNLVCTMLSTSGFNVIDLGVDVHEDAIVEAVKANDANAVALSILLTPMVDSIGDAVKALQAAGLREKVKVAIGGACTTQELADRYGIDALGRDAVEAVRIFEGFCA
jgi:methylmalonyl-CoA mutase cobalamin-binding domain/chain